MSRVFWDVSSETFYVVGEHTVHSAPLSTLSIGPFNRVEGVPDTAIEFAPERRVPQIVSAHAILGAISRAMGEVRS